MMKFYAETVDADTRRAVEGSRVVANDGESAEAMVYPVEEYTCQWFALCENPAETTEPHPILGDVPICGRCAAKVAAM